MQVFFWDKSGIKDQLMLVAACITQHGVAEK